MKDVILDFYLDHPGEWFRPMEVAERLGYETHQVAVASYRLAETEKKIKRWQPPVLTWTRKLSLYGHPDNEQRQTHRAESTP